MTRNTALALLMTLPILAACGTPREQCVSRNTTEYRTVSSLLAEVEGNLARGYEWRERQVVRDRMTHCRSYRRDAEGNTVPVFVPCWRDYVDTERYRVPIDPEVETRKRDNLAARQAELAPRAEAVVAACRAAHPEDEA